MSSIIDNSLIEEKKKIQTIKPNLVLPSGTKNEPQTIPIIRYTT